MREKGNSIAEIVFNHSKNIPNKVCLIEDNKKITYDEYFRLVYGFSKYLQKKGLKKGDYVVVKTMQNIAFFVSGLAVQLAGGIFVPVESNVADKRLKEIIDITDAKLLIANKKYNYDLPQVKIASAMEHSYESEIEEDDLKFPDESDVAEVLFTTGTTGKSKGVICSHKSVIAIAQNVTCGVAMKENNIEIIPGPYNHSNPLRRYYSNMYNGSCVITMDGVIFINKLFDAIKNHQATALALVPAFVTMIFKLSRDKISQFANQLDYIQVGGAMFSGTDKEYLSELLPNTRLYDFYGSTEAGCACTTEYKLIKDKQNCIGKPTVNSKFIFLDSKENQVEATAENPAFLACGGDMCMDGYYKDEELTKETVKNGYVISNDLGYQDEEGYLYVLGRQDDVINMGGNKISPLEIEEAVGKFSKVEECACVPVEDKILGEAPKLFVVMKDGEEFDRKEITVFLSAEIDGSKMPKIVKELDELPKTYNGKIEKKKLREM